ncbi:hypothetical protein QNI16_31780 [Cytophagaceae bacterium YF14B1]|uniref:Peptidase S1 domain-containing protein n=1 Tax=Xanthocytophaga flava TaxID=3048013 RepID=A0AAE3QTE0_9BACT|nr:trypsin-like serine protease [Xanthocytophaga flavus]MDJ1485122.1 hypothetical protein [Xanthocytophaga flavus]
MNKNLLYKLPFLLTIIAHIGCSSSQKNTGSLKADIYNQERWMKQPFTQAPQILLTNQADFTDHESLFGASAFLLTYHNQTFAVTAKHLIVEAGGVTPPIKASELNQLIQVWNLYPRAGMIDTVLIDTLINTSDQIQNDILIFSIKSLQTSFYPLKPRFQPVNERDTLYVIGCPYTEEECRQNKYPIQFLEANNNLLTFEGMYGIQLRGFSGCPIIDQNGYVVGILTSGGEQNGKNYVIAEAISIIKDILP